MSPLYKAVVNQLIVEGKTKEEAEQQLRSLLKSNADLGLLLKGCERVPPPGRKNLIEKFWDLQKRLK